MDQQPTSIALTTRPDQQETRISRTFSGGPAIDDYLPKHLDVKSEDYECKKHGQYSAEFVFIGGRWRGDNACPVCSREKRALESAEESATDCQRQIDSAIKKAGIPKRFSGKTFSGYRVDTGNLAQKKALDVCKSYAQNFDTVLERGTCLVLCGRPGTGKNHLVAAITNELISSKKYTVLFTRVYSAIRAIKETFRGDSSTTERDVLAAYIGVDLLVLDEVGVQFNSDYERMMMFEIINSRYDEVRPTILISNLNAADVEKFVGERVWDRLFEDGGVVLPFDWGSERRKRNLRAG